MELKLEDICYIAEAHNNRAREPSKSYRKWAGKTPYYVHPLWCASMISMETKLDENVREIGVQVLLYHDVLEDTTEQIPSRISQDVRDAIDEMTVEGGTAVEMETIWTKSPMIRLFKLYDKVSNLLDGDWMDRKKRRDYSHYVMELCRDVENNYGEMNITRIARVVAEARRW